MASRKNKKLRLEYSRYWTNRFQELNKLYFEGQLPHTEIFYATLKPVKKNSFRYAITNIKNGRAKGVVINKDLRHIGEDTTELSLLHEMIHVKYPEVDIAFDHGDLFKKERRRLILAGAFDELI